MTHKHTPLPRHCLKILRSPTEQVVWFLPVGVFEEEYFNDELFKYLIFFHIFTHFWVIVFFPPHISMQPGIVWEFKFPFDILTTEWTVVQLWHYWSAHCTSRLALQAAGRSGHPCHTHLRALWNPNGPLSSPLPQRPTLLPLVTSGQCCPPGC